jgi:hypothetical protein
MRTMMWYNLLQISKSIFQNIMQLYIFNDLNRYCRKSLQFYRGKDCDISVEFNEILKQNADKASKAKCWRSTIKRIASPAFWRPFKCVGVLLLVLIATFIFTTNNVKSGIVLLYEKTVKLFETKTKL